MNKKFESFRTSELASQFSDFEFHDILKTASNNDYWQSKTGLWQVISGACNDARKTILCCYALVY